MYKLLSRHSSWWSHKVYRHFVPRSLRLKILFLILNIWSRLIISHISRERINDRQNAKNRSVALFVGNSHDATIFPQKLLYLFCWQSISIYSLDFLQNIYAKEKKEREPSISSHCINHKRVRLRDWCVMYRMKETIGQLKYWPRPSPLGFSNSCATNSNLTVWDLD